jgi:hypothetical protein
VTKIPERNILKEGGFIFVSWFNRGLEGKVEQAS